MARSARTTSLQALPPNQGKSCARTKGRQIGFPPQAVHPLSQCKLISVAFVSPAKNSRQPHIQICQKKTGAEQRSPPPPPPSQQQTLDGGAREETNFDAATSNMPAYDDQTKTNTGHAPCWQARLETGTHIHTRQEKKIVLLRVTRPRALSKLEPT